MSDYRFFVSEVCEEGERIGADRILREIHDAMCMCGVGPDECDTEGVQTTVLQAAQGLLAHGKWSIDFEDGWMRVESIEPKGGRIMCTTHEWLDEKPCPYCAAEASK